MAESSVVVRSPGGVWTERACVHCGRIFKGNGPQERCKRRDCTRHGEAPIQRRERLLREEQQREEERLDAENRRLDRFVLMLEFRAEKYRQGRELSTAVELAELIEQQERELQAPLRAHYGGKGSRSSVVGTYSLDATFASKRSRRAVYRHSEFIPAGGEDEQWGDPTFDAVLHRLDQEHEAVREAVHDLNRQYVDGSLVPVDATCSKVRYISRQDAEEALTALNRKGRGEENAYRCFCCNGYHLTSRSTWLAGRRKPWLRLVDVPDDVNGHAAGNGLVGRMATNHRGRTAQSVLMQGTRPERKPRNKK